MQEERGESLLGYITCSLSRAIRLEMLSSLETSSFITCLMCLVAHCGRPRVIYSDIYFTPSTFLFQRTSQLPEEKTWRIEKLDQHKRPKYLMNCKNSLWRRWQREYLIALKEWHNLTHKAAKLQPNVAYVVIIKTKSKNCRS